MNRASALLWTLPSLCALCDCSADAEPAAAADAGAETSSCSQARWDALEAPIVSALARAAADPEITGDPDFTLLLQRSDGHRFTSVHGHSGADVSYESASTSKLVSAVVILDLVDQGKLRLDTRASALVPAFADSTITLRQLLNFTSGLRNEPLCLNAPNAVFDNCIRNIYAQNQPLGSTPGSEFYYASTHLQVAGMMAIKAADRTSWQDLWQDFRARTELFPSATYDLPSEGNPRLAGGMHWTAQEYLAFLSALQDRSLLSSELRQMLFANQRGPATVGYSPALGRTDERGLGEDWAYGLGNWLECPSATTAGSYACGAGHRNSSPGAYGAYPFLDFDHHYVGILARQGALGSYTEGVQLFRAAQDAITRWADEACE